MPRTAHTRRVDAKPGRRGSAGSISLRVPAPTLDLITSAAAVAGKSRTEFMLESARREAIDVLLDQRIFELDSERYDAFLRILDNPPPPNEKLKRLLATKAPWET